MVRTKSPNPVFPLEVMGHNYHFVWFGPAEYLEQVGHDGYVDAPVGSGLYSLDEFKPGERAVWSRWDDFWVDYDSWKKPQHKTMEWLLVKDEGARFSHAVKRSGGHGHRRALLHRWEASACPSGPSKT